MNYNTGAQLWRLGPIVTNPVVQAGVTANSLSLSWPTLAVGFDLEAATNLASSPTWNKATNATLVVGNQTTVSVQPTSSRQFYRLHRP